MSRDLPRPPSESSHPIVIASSSDCYFTALSQTSKSLLLLTLIMKSISTLLTFAAAASALSLLEPDQAVLGDDVQLQRFLIELGPGDTRWISEDEKWSLRRVRLPPIRNETTADC